MKCPKCKYSTFDYLDTCPRCGKDMTEEKAKLNIFSIKPNPHFLLGSLTGDLNENAFGIEELESVEGGAENIGLEIKEVYDDGSELSINIDQESVSEPDENLELNIDDLNMSSDDKELELNFISDDISLEMSEEAVKMEDGIQEKKGLGEGADKESVHKEEPEKDIEEIDLEPEELEMNLELEEDEDSKE